MSAETTTLRIGEATTVVVTGTTGPRGPAGADASYSDAVPHALGSASAGVTDAAARADHVHAMPSAADVGADATGTASTAVSSHAAAVDPHGDRAYTDALLAQHIVDGTVPTIEYTMTASGVDTYSVTIPNTVRAAVYVPPPHDEWPPGDHDGVVEVEPPVDGNTPSWWVVLPTTSPTSFAAAWRDFIDANDHTTVVGAYTDAGSLGGVLASQGLYLCHVVPIATPRLLWSGSTPADASTLLDIIAVIAGKEDAGTAAARTGGGLLADRPSAASLTPGARYFAEDDGDGTDYVVDTSLAWVQAAPPVAIGAPAIPHVSGEHYSLHGGEANSVACSPSASGELRALPVYLPAGAYDRIGVWVQTVGTSTWRFGVYPCDPTNLWPDGQTLIVDAGTMNMSTTTGYRLLATSFTVTTPGIHWITILTDAYTSRPSVMGWLTSDGATPSDVPWIGSRHLTAGGGRSLWIRSKTGVTTGSMPATFPTSSSWTDQGPQLTVRAT